MILHAILAVLAATPATLPAQLALAKPGDTVVLAEGTYGPTSISGRAFAPALTVDARAADLTGWTLPRTSGVHVLGGTWHAPKTAGGFGSALAASGSSNPDGSPKWDCADISVSGAMFVGPETRVQGQPYQQADGYGFNALRCNGVKVTGSYFASFQVAVLAGLSKAVTFTDSECAFMRADCLNLGQVWGADIERITCHGTRITALEHPDCIQGYSRPTWPNVTTPAPPTSDLVIRGNTVFGDMQGIFLGNHVRADAKGVLVDDGGFDRVKVEDNTITMGGGSAINVVAVRVGVVRNNHAMTLPSAPTIAGVNTGSSPGIARCGNVADAGGGKRRTADPACPGTAP